MSAEAIYCGKTRQEVERWLKEEQVRVDAGEEPSRDCTFYNVALQEIGRQEREIEIVTFLQPVVNYEHEPDFEVLKHVLREFYKKRKQHMGNASYSDEEFKALIGDITRSLRLDLL